MIILFLLSVALCDVEIAHTPEDVNAFKTEHNDEMMAFLFENDHPNNNFWHSLVNSFQEEKQTDDVEDEMGTHLLKIDCSQERLADTCEYYDALTLPEIQLYEDGELLLKETVDENTERKIEKIKAGEPMEVTVEYN